MCFIYLWGFPHSSVGKESACNAEDLGSIPGLGRSPGKGNDNPLQYSGWVTVHGVPRVWHDLATKPPSVQFSSVTQSCPTLCDPMDSSMPGFSVHGILQARILEWVAIPFSRGSSWPRDQTCISCIGRQILYHWATRRAQHESESQWGSRA